MILERLVDELRFAEGPVMNREMARRLGVDESALDGMLDVLAAKGVLSVPSEMAGGEDAVCSGMACGTSCVGLEKCPFVAKVPVTHTFVGFPTRQ